VGSRGLDGGPSSSSPCTRRSSDAWIYQTTPKGVERVEYEDTDHFQVTRSFLNRRDVFLETLLSEDE
jgi:predicted ATPase